MSKLKLIDQNRYINLDKVVSVDILERKLESILVKRQLDLCSKKLQKKLKNVKWECYFLRFNLENNNFIDSCYFFHIKDATEVLTNDELSILEINYSSESTSSEGLIKEIIIINDI